MPRVDPELIGPYLRFLEDPWFKERYDWSYGITYKNYCPPPFKDWEDCHILTPVYFHLSLAHALDVSKNPSVKKNSVLRY